MNQQFALSDFRQARDLIADLTHPAAFGEPTRVEELQGVRYFVNAFWTARQRQAHSDPRGQLSRLLQAAAAGLLHRSAVAAGDVVHDPFMGRGTTPVEAALKGRIPYGNDTNPLSRAFTAPRIDAPAAVGGRGAAARDPVGDLPGGRARGPAGVLSSADPGPHRRPARLAAGRASGPRPSTGPTPGSAWSRSTGSPGIPRASSRSIRCRPTRPCRSGARAGSTRRVGRSRRCGTCRRSSPGSRRPCSETARRAATGACS